MMTYQAWIMMILEEASQQTTKFMEKHLQHLQEMH